MDINIKTWIIGFNEAFTFFCVFPSVILLGLYLTFRLQFVQVTKLKQSFAALLQSDEGTQGNISRFEAISAVLAGNFGTGNISGIAVAIGTGGPGALIWMWVMAFLGAAIQYASCVLGVKYRKLNSENEYAGGPMYYLADGLGFKKLGAFFAIAILLGAITVGNFVQVNSMLLPLHSLGIDPLLCGIGLAVFVGYVTLGGMSRMAKFASLIVPFKACLYLVFALIILALHLDKVPAAFEIMLRSALHPSSVAGGVLGMGVMKAITTGFDRGIFATDAGTGIVPILQSSAKTSNPVVDGLCTLVTPFLVMIVCTMTGLVLLVTGAWQHAELKSTNMVTYAFQQGLGSELGAYVVIVSLILFGYTTLLAWACCAEKASGYLWGTTYSKWIKYIYIALIPVGTLLQVDMVWVLADICITLLLVSNMIGIAGLSEEVIVASRAYFGEQEEQELLAENA